MNESVKLVQDLLVEIQANFVSVQDYQLYKIVWLIQLKERLKKNCCWWLVMFWQPLTLKMSLALRLPVTNTSYFQNYLWHDDDHAWWTNNIPGFKPLSIVIWATSFVCLIANWKGEFAFYTRRWYSKELAYFQREQWWSQEKNNSVQKGAK